MADYKRKSIVFYNGKQLKLYGTSLAISKSLEIGEGYAPNVLSLPPESTTSDKPSLGVNNPFQLSPEEIHELADYNIQLWLELKDNIRKHGINSLRIFNSESKA